MSGSSEKKEKKARYGIADVFERVDSEGRRVTSFRDVDTGQEIHEGSVIDEELGMQQFAILADDFREAFKLYDKAWEKQRPGVVEALRNMSSRLLLPPGHEKSRKLIDA